MKKRKASIKVKEKRFDTTIYISNNIEIVRDNKGNLYFKVGSELSNDLAEGVALLMRDKKAENDYELWSIKILTDPYNISPEKCLYWLSGGDSEWNIKDNYKKNWGECYNTYQDEFGDLICDIIIQSNTLGDLRKYFLSELNMLKLYEFALSRGLA